MGGLFTLQQRPHPLSISPPKQGGARQTSDELQYFLFCAGSLSVVRRSLIIRRSTPCPIPCRIWKAHAPRFLVSSEKNIHSGKESDKSRGPWGGAPITTKNISAWDCTETNPPEFGSRAPGADARSCKRGNSFPAPGTDLVRFGNRRDRSVRTSSCATAAR
jgi:hypothetical protein